MCRRGNQYVACGIVAGGIKACNIKYSSYFTRLSEYREWIRKKIEGDLYSLSIRHSIWITHLIIIIIYYIYYIYNKQNLQSVSNKR